MEKIYFEGRTFARVIHPHFFFSVGPQETGAQPMSGRAPVFFLILSNEKGGKKSWQGLSGKKFFALRGNENYAFTLAFR